ncbi:hypothetical protein GJAV_G00052270 [Gymnothorax javanicus]|nr:hypothetical protein GJAV_G00052270 [Gymnothorax javanicus]
MDSVLPLDAGPVQLPVNKMAFPSVSAADYFRYLRSEASTLASGLVFAYNVDPWNHRDAEQKNLPENILYFRDHMCPTLCWRPLASAGSMSGEGYSGCPA